MLLKGKLDTFHVAVQPVMTVNVLNNELLSVRCTDELLSCPAAESVLDYRLFQLRQPGGVLTLKNKSVLFAVWCQKLTVGRETQLSDQHSAN